MAVQRFEDLIVWQKAQELAITVYQSFGNCNDFGFGDQIRRASVSVSTILQKGSKEAQMQNFPNFCFIPWVRIVKSDQWFIFPSN